MRALILRKVRDCSHCAALPTRRSYSQVETLSDEPSPEEFATQYFEKKPVVIKGGAAHWPATTKWTSAYLREHCGDATVRIEVGGSYLEPQTETLEVPFERYLGYLESLGEHETPPKQGLAYLAQADIPALFEERSGGGMDGGGDGGSGGGENSDAPWPSWCASSGRGDRYATMAWVGPCGTLTPLHRDPYHNCFACVHGRKKWLLFEPPQRHPLQPGGAGDGGRVASDAVAAVVDQALERALFYPSTDPLQRNSSLVDAEAPDFARFPRFAEAQAAAFEVELGPGDLLYVPKRWWHHVRSLSKATCVSFWWL
mmetsp:Transcript_39530/g.79826  ORF Transcript_39530/g.79826 Transcript_39530/m.79826 type:complete len:313 (-) Transcript_39530:182-1120(-)